MFIPQYSALTNRLMGIKKAEKFTWNEEIELYYMELKKAITKGGYKCSLTLGYEIPSY